MKTVADLSVTVKYSVGLGGIEVPDEVFDQLLSVCESGREVDAFNEMQNAEAMDWLRTYISENDCCNLEYTIDEIEEDCD